MISLSELTVCWKLELLGSHEITAEVEVMLAAWRSLLVMLSRGQLCCHLDTRGAQGGVLADDHGAGRVSGGPPVDGHGPHADPVRLQK